MIKTEVNIRQSYSLYKELFGKEISINIYIKLANDYNKFLLDKVFEGNEITLPSKMGTISIVGTKQKITYNEQGNPSLSPNWKKTKELWERNQDAKDRKQLIYNLNEHTTGIRYKFLWSKVNVITENKNLYSLRMTRANKRLLHDLIMKGKEYFVKQ